MPLPADWVTLGKYSGYTYSVPVSWASNTTTSYSLRDELRNNWRCWNSSTTSTEYQVMAWRDRLNSCIRWTDYEHLYHYVADNPLPEGVISINQRRVVPPTPPTVYHPQTHDGRRVAEDRAHALLMEMLPPDQRERFAREGIFEVVGSHGTLYRVRNFVSGNVEWIKPDGSVGGRLCAHPCMRDGWLPTADVMLSQFLALTTDERAFVEQANVHAGTAPPRLRLIA